MQQPKPTFQFVFIFMVATAIVLYGCEKEEPMPHMTIYLPTDTTSTPQLWPTHIQIVNAADMHPISGADVYLYCDYESWFGDEVTGPPLLHKISDSDGMT